MRRPGLTREEIGQRLRASLLEAHTLRSAPPLGSAAEQRRQALRCWQSDRLTRTYPDLLSDPKTRDAAVFFREEVYGTRDLTARDADIERVTPLLVRIMPLAALEVIERAMQLDALSELLDTRVAAALPSTAIDDVSYASAYRQAGTRQERLIQLDHVRGIGETLAALVRVPLLGAVLSAMHGPASAAGLAELHDFLRRGYEAFRKIKEPERFIGTIVTRETRLLERLFAGTREPFVDLARP